MRIRQLTLSVVLGISFSLMVLYLMVRGSLTSPELGVFVGFGLALVGYAAWSFATSRPDTSESWHKFPHTMRVAIASFGIAGGISILFAISVLPLIGYEGLFFLGSPWYLLVLVVLVATLFPFVRKRLK